MDVAGRRRVGGVGVAVGVEPDQSDRVALAREVVARAGHGPDGDAVIAAEDERRSPLSQAPLDLLAQLLARGEHRLLVAQLAGSDLLRLGDLDVDVAEIDDLVAERFEARLEVGDANRGRPHVDAAAAGAEVDGNANDFDVTLLGGHGAAEFSSGLGKAVTLPIPLWRKRLQAQPPPTAPVPGLPIGIARPRESRE